MSEGYIWMPIIFIGVEAIASLLGYQSTSMKIISGKVRHDNRKDR